MIINIENCSSRTRAKQIVSDVANVFSEKLSNRFFFDEKLRRLTVYPFDVPVSKPYALFKAHTDKYSCRYEIILVFNSKRFNPKYIAFAVAHEFGHLLIFEKNSSKRLSIELEEALADYLAYYIINNLQYKDPSSSFEKRCNSLIPQRKKEVVANLENLFGKSLPECEKIDATNLFWHFVANNDWSIIENMYQQITGKSFEEFQCSLKDYLN